MRKIRVGNDFWQSFQIKEKGVIADLLQVKDTVQVFAKVGDKCFEVPKEMIKIKEDGIITVEVKTELFNIVGRYEIIVKYWHHDISMSDDDRKQAVNFMPFVIVGKTEMADSSEDIPIVGDIIIGLKGDSAFDIWNIKNGGNNTYDDWIDFLQAPATQIEGIVSANEAVRIENENTRKANEQTRQSNESARVTAEIDRESNEDTRSLNEAARLTNEDDRIANENQRVIDEGKREQLYDNTVILKGEVETLKTETETAKDSAISAATLANEKANLANVAAQSANEAAGLADTAQMELTTAVNTKLGEADDKIEEMDTTLSTYDGRVIQAESDISQLEGDVRANMLTLKNELTYGDFEATNPILKGDSGTMSTFTHNDVSPISGLKDARLVVHSGGAVNYPRLDIRTAELAGDEIGTKYLLMFKYKVNSGIAKLNGLHNGLIISSAYGQILTGEGEYSKVIERAGSGDVLGRLHFDSTYSVFDIQIDDIMLINLTKAFGEIIPSDEELEYLKSKLTYVTEKTIMLPQLYNDYLALSKKHDDDKDSLTEAINDIAGNVYDALGLKKIPQKMIIGEADYSYDPESTSGLTADGGSLSLNTEQVYAGNYSVKFSGNDTGNTNISKSISLTDEMLDSFKIAVYMHDVQLPTDSIRVDLHDGIYNKYMTQTFKIEENLLQPGKWMLLGGRNWMKYNDVVASDITTLRLSLNGFRTTEISIDLIEFGLKRYPSCLITFDDGKLSDYTNAYPSLKARGMVATTYIVSDYVGTPNFMANNHLHELYENGWCIGNHTKSHDNLNTMTVPEQIASLSGCNDYLNSIGIATGLHAAYPYNAIDRSNILEVVQSVGLKTGRISGVFGNMHDGWNYPFYNMVRSHDQPVDPDGITIKNHIDQCILRGRTPGILFHEVGTTSSYISQQTFDNILDYIKSLGLTTLNMDEFYRLNANDVVINHK